MRIFITLFNDEDTQARLHLYADQIKENLENSGIGPVTITDNCSNTIDLEFDDGEP